MIKVSVIIPVYNTENYIRECLLSVMNQTYRNLEIIVVDDGSVDKSVEICKKLKKDDGRIRILCQKHQGVSAARNKGLAVSSGEYIFFMDSDDAIHPCLLKELAGQVERSHVELVFCTYVKLNTKKIKKIRKREKICSGHTKDIWETGEAWETAEWFHMKHSRELSCIGGKMISRHTIGAERFDECLASGEDTVFLYHLSIKRIKMSCLKKKWYYYRERSKSTSVIDADRSDVNKFKAYRIIRNSEYKQGHISWVLEWEYRYIWKLLTEYLTARNEKRKRDIWNLKRLIKKEREYFVYRRFPKRTKLVFDSLYLCCKVWPVRKLWLLKQRMFHIFGK